jgi:hypothetical protein
MFKKMTLGKLSLLFLFLLVLVALVVYLDQRKGKKTFRTDLFEADTAKVSALIIYPRADRDNPIEIIKDKSGWELKITDKKYSADAGAVKEMLCDLNDLRATRVAATDKSKWKEYEVDDTSATRVVVKAGRKIVSTLFIGKFSYRMPKNVNPYDYYNQQAKISTYVRVDDEKHVYVVEGFLGMVFNRNANDFRDKAIIRSDRKNWKKLTFSYPADSSFTLIKEKGKWTLEGIMLDSASVDEYLSSITWLSCEDFVDDQKPVSSQAQFSLKIEGDNMVEPLVVKAFAADTMNGTIITSTLNEGVYFSGKKSGMSNRIFIGKKKFLVK